MEVGVVVVVGFGLVGGVLLGLLALRSLPAEECVCSGEEV